MDDLILQEELGKGQYGTVQKVKHRVTNVTMAMKVVIYVILGSCNCVFNFLSFRRFD